MIDGITGTTENRGFPSSFKTTALRIYPINPYNSTTITSRLLPTTISCTCSTLRIALYLFYIDREMTKFETTENNRSAMRTWGLMLKFIPFGWNAVLKISVSGSWNATSEMVDKSLQLISGKCMAEYCSLTLTLLLIILEGFHANIKPYMGNSTLQTFHSESKFWN